MAPLFFDPPGTREWRIREYFRLLCELPDTPERQREAEVRSGITDEDFEEMAICDAIEEMRCVKFFH